MSRTHNVRYLRDLPLGFDGLLKVRYLLVSHVFFGLCLHRSSTDLIILILLHLLQGSLLCSPLRLNLRWVDSDLDFSSEFS